MTEQDLRLALLNTLLSTPHRELARVYPLHKQIIDGPAFIWAGRCTPTRRRPRPQEMLSPSLRFRFEAIARPAWRCGAPVPPTNRRSSISSGRHGDPHVPPTGRPLVRRVPAGRRAGAREAPRHELLPISLSGPQLPRSS